jgi:hypothetical protein
LPQSDNPTSFDNHLALLLVLNRLLSYIIHAAQRGTEIDMPGLTDVFISINPFSSELLPLLEVWDTLSLSLTCTEIRSHLYSHPKAFTNLDLRHPAAVAAIRRLEEREHQTLPIKETCTRNFLQYLYCAYAVINFSGPAAILPLGIQKLLPPHRKVAVSVLRLDGLNVDLQFLAQVFPHIAPTLQILGLSFLGDHDRYTEKLVDEFLLHKWPRLKVLKFLPPGPVREPELRRLLSAVEDMGLQLDITVCNSDDGKHAVGGVIVPLVWRNCELCGAAESQAVCEDCSRGTGSASTCGVCFGFYCKQCVITGCSVSNLPGDVPPTAFHMCPRFFRIPRY